MTQLKFLRNQSGETQAELANFLGITRAAYTNIENGKREPDYDTIKKLANHFSVTIDYLLGNEKTPVIDNDDRGKTDSSKGKIAADIMSQLSPDKQEAALNYLRFLAQQENEKN